MNNKTEMTYSPTGGRVKIVETGSGSVTSTKQFIGSEERDGSGNVTKQFFSRGQRNGSTNYFYGRDHLGSIRIMTDDSGNVQASYGFDPYGRSTKLAGAQDSDFLFAGYYSHPRSGLNLTLTRPYSAELGRFIGRDPIAETGGVNLFAYVGQNPVGAVDPAGLQSLETGNAHNWTPPDGADLPGLIVPDITRPDVQYIIDVNGFKIPVKVPPWERWGNQFRCRRTKSLPRYKQWNEDFPVYQEGPRYRPDWSQDLPPNPFHWTSPWSFPTPPPPSLNPGSVA